MKSEKYTIYALLCFVCITFITLIKGETARDQRIAQVKREGLWKKPDGVFYRVKEYQEYFQEKYTQDAHDTKRNKLRTELYDILSKHDTTIQENNKKIAELKQQYDSVTPEVQGNIFAEINLLRQPDFELQNYIMSINDVIFLSATLDVLKEEEQITSNLKFEKSAINSLSRMYLDYENDYKESIKKIKEIEEQEKEIAKEIAQQKREQQLLSKIKKKKKKEIDNYNYKIKNARFKEIYDQISKNDKTIQENNKKIAELEQQYDSATPEVQGNIFAEINLLRQPDFELQNYIMKLDPRIFNIIEEQQNKGLNLDFDALKDINLKYKNNESFFERQYKSFNDLSNMKKLGLVIGATAVGYGVYKGGKYLWGKFKTRKSSN
jgi:myosin heavy subunit